MPISHVFAEGIGPFKSVHLDLRGPDGKPSLGPHVLAGVNGSGKSTLLKAIAWSMANEGNAFPSDEWAHRLRTDSDSRLLWINEGGKSGYRYSVATTTDLTDGWDKRVLAWARRCLVLAELDPAEFPSRGSFKRLLGSASHTTGWVRLGGAEKLEAGLLHNVAAYSSTPVVRYLDRPNLDQPREAVKSIRLGFESSVQNDAIQPWLLGLCDVRATARESGLDDVGPLSSLERCLTRISGERVELQADNSPNCRRPMLRIGSQTLNFSQLPDGVRVTLGWLTDFLMRGDSRDWDPLLASKRPGLLLFDEIEGFLHPLWQRRVLPALREALPSVQSIVASHSPFVISSCPGAIIHVLKVNSDGTAYAEKPVPAPIGESITSTLKDIFGVESRFDVETEQQLAEWNDLRKIEMQRKLSAADEARLHDLSATLASRSEELRSLVAPTVKLPKATIDSLTASASRRRKDTLATR